MYSGLNFIKYELHIPFSHFIGFLSLPYFFEIPLLEPKFQACQASTLLLNHNDTLFFSLVKIL